MKKLVLFCAIALAFAFVGCKSNKTAAPAEATAAPETEQMVAADSAVCPETGKVCEQKAECENAEAKACENAEAKEACAKKAECEKAEAKACEKAESKKLID